MNCSSTGNNMRSAYGCAVFPLSYKMSLASVFSNEFMQEYTKFGSYQEMMDLILERTEAGKSIGTFEMDIVEEVVNEQTEFLSWAQMYAMAENYYLMKLSEFGFE